MLPSPECRGVEASPQSESARDDERSGTLIVNFDPHPTSVFIVIVPPRSSSSFRTLYSPNPTPPKWRVMALSPGGTVRR